MSPPPPPPPPPSAFQESVDVVVDAIKFGSYASSERRRSITDTNPSDAWAGIALAVSSGSFWMTCLIVVLKIREIWGI